MPADLMDHILNLFQTCDTAKYAVIYPHGPVTYNRVQQLGTVSFPWLFGQKKSGEIPESIIPCCCFTLPEHLLILGLCLSSNLVYVLQIVQRMSMGMPGGCHYEGCIVRLKQ